jgi:hypothetical protein
MNDEQSGFAVKKTISGTSVYDSNASYTPKSPTQLPFTNHCSTTNPNPSISINSQSTYLKMATILQRYLSYCQRQTLFCYHHFLLCQDQKLFTGMLFIHFSLPFADKS